MRKLMKIMTSLLLVFALSGCMKYKMNVDVDSDGKASTNVKIMLSEDFIKNYLKTTDKQVISSFSSSLKKSAKNTKITKIKETHNKMTYVGVQATASSSKTIKTKVKDGKVSVTIPVSDITNALTESGLSSSSLNTKAYSVESLESAGVEISLTVNMPGKPTTNVGTVKDHTVKIDLLKEMMKDEDKRVKTIKITSPTNKYTKVIIAIAVAAGVLAVVLLIIFLRKRHKKKRENDDSEEKEVITPAKELENAEEDKPD